MQRPVLLRLESDEFMDVLNARLAADPPTLVGLVAKPKTFRPGPARRDDPAGDQPRQALSADTWSLQPGGGHPRLPSSGAP